MSTFFSYTKNKINLLPMMNTELHPITVCLFRVNQKVSHDLEKLSPFKKMFAEKRTTSNDPNQAVGRHLNNSIPLPYPS